jgi:hypothetical protein
MKKKYVLQFAPLLETEHFGMSLRVNHVVVSSKAS